MGIQIPNLELVVSSHLCIVYFFHSSSLNYNLLCWQSRSLFKINEHDALPNPIWAFHSYCWISEPDPTSFMSALKKYILKLSQFFYLFIYFFLVGCFCHRLYSFFLCVDTTISAVKVSSVQEETRWKYQGPGQNLALMVLQGGQMFMWLQP